MHGSIRPRIDWEGSEARMACAHTFVKGNRTGIGLDHHSNRAETSGPSCCPLEQQAANS